MYSEYMCYNIDLNCSCCFTREGGGAQEKERGCGADVA
jgi:hypothetical protein